MLDRIADVLGGLFGQAVSQIQPDQIAEQLRNFSFDPGQMQDLLGQQLDLEALGLQDINFAELGPDQIMALLQERGIDVSQLDLGGLTEQFGDGSTISDFVGQLGQGVPKS